MSDREEIRRGVVEILKSSFLPYVTNAEWRDYGDKIWWEVQLPGGPREGDATFSQVKNPSDLRGIIRIHRRDLEREGIKLAPAPDSQPGRVRCQVLSPLEHSLRSQWEATIGEDG